MGDLFKDGFSTITAAISKGDTTLFLVLCLFLMGLVAIYLIKDEWPRMLIAMTVIFSFLGILYLTYAYPAMQRSEKVSQVVTDEINTLKQTIEQLNGDLKKAQSIEKFSPTLLGKWRNFAEDWSEVEWGVCEYYKINNVVFLSGAIADGTGDIFVLPAGYRPSSHSMFAATSSSGFRRVDVYTNGRVVTFGNATDHLSLNGISFVVINNN